MVAQGFVTPRGNEQLISVLILKLLQPRNTSKESNQRKACPKTLLRGRARSLAELSCPNNYCLANLSRMITAH